MRIGVLVLVAATACGGGQPTAPSFGVLVRFETTYGATPPEPTSIVFCPGSDPGYAERGYQLDRLHCGFGSGPPCVYLDVARVDDRMAGSPYRVVVEEGPSTGTMKAVVDRTYDEAFGSAGRSDSFDVVANGFDYHVEVSGIPAGAPCSED